MVTVMKERQMTLLGLCETCWRGSRRRVLHHDYQLIHSGGKENKHGVAILSSAITHRIKEVHQVNERLVRITLKMDDDLTIIQV